MEYKKSYKKWSNKGKTLNPESLTVNQGRPEPKRKRGKLASLMSEDAKATASIHELSYDFGCRVTRLFQYLTEDADQVWQEIIKLAGVTCSSDFQKLERQLQRETLGQLRELGASVRQLERLTGISRGIIQFV
jgi:hypothetical protein